MSDKELKPRKWKDGEEALWLADKVCILGDYGQDAARVLRRQAEELDRLRGEVASVMQKLQIANEAFAAMSDTRRNESEFYESRLEQEAEKLEPLQQEMAGYILANSLLKDNKKELQKQVAMLREALRLEDARNWAVGIKSEEPTPSALTATSETAKQYENAIKDK